MSKPMTKRSMFLWAAIPAALVFLVQAAATLAFTWGQNWSKMYTHSVATFDTYNRWLRATGQPATWLPYGRNWHISHFVVIQPVIHWNYSPFVYGLLLIVAGATSNLVRLPCLFPSLRTRAWMTASALLWAGCVASTVSLICYHGAADWLQLPWIPASGWFALSGIFNAADVAIVIGQVLTVSVLLALGVPVVRTVWRQWSRDLGQAAMVASGGGGNDDR